jgi:membrane-associated phospholipid phosphatase
MKERIRSIGYMSIVAVALGCAGVAPALSEPMPRVEGWLANSYDQVVLPASPNSVQSELAALRGMVAKRTPDDVARFQWWSAGGPVYRWNEIILSEMQDGFVTLPIAVRHLALFHAALDDATAAARQHRKSGARAQSSDVDAAVNAKLKSAAALSPSEYAAAAAAAGEMFGYLFPARAAHLAGKAEEAMQARLLAGAEYPYEVAAGRAIGQLVATLAIARGKSDGSDAKWTGAAPEGKGLWKGANPIAPLAGTWKPWVLTHSAELRPATPPDVESDQVKAALNELKTFARTPKSNHRATFWEVNGGARAHTLWNDMARAKLLEHRYAPHVASRILTALNVALFDAGVACWDAKYTFWYARPAMLDPEVKPLFATPNHPSFPSAHSCFSTAAATVLARVFPSDGGRLLAVGKEASEARIWAGIHYRFDLDAGEDIGRKVAERTLERAFGARTN